MSLIDSITARFRRAKPVEPTTTLDVTAAAHRPGPLDLLDDFRAETERVEIIRQCRLMYKTDMRIKRLIGTLARDVTRGGFTFHSEDVRSQTVLTALAARTRIVKGLNDWVRLALRDGDTLLEVGVNAQAEIIDLTRKPTLEMRRNSDPFDRFADPARAFWWGPAIWWGMEPPNDAVWFADWQIVHARWAHDEGSRYGEPLFSAATSAFKRMREGELDIAVRRKTRAGLRYNHQFPPGTDPGAIEKYQEINKEALEDPYAATADFFGTTDIKAIGGDATLNQIEDVLHHIRSLWTASPVPMSAIGYGQDINRDVLEKQKEQYDEELPPIMTWVEDDLVKPIADLQLLLAGILPETAAYTIVWKPKKVLTAAILRDVADAAIRLRALGLPDELILQVLAPFLPGIDLEQVMLKPSNLGQVAAGAVGLGV
jgi:hypothetical protein